MECVKENLKKNTNIDSSFIDEFYETLDTNTFCISLEDSFKWLGYTRIDNAKRLLINEKLEFIENEDYIINIIKTKAQKDKELILMKPETFKMLAMSAKTIQGTKTRRYYVKIEQEYRNLCKKYNEEIIKSPFDNKISFDYVDISKYKNMWVCYILHIENDLYKFGYSGNIIERCREHKSKRQWVKVVDIFKTLTKQNAEDAEHKFLRYIEANNLKADYIDNTFTKSKEVFRAKSNISNYTAIYSNFVKETIDNSHKNFNGYYEKEENLKNLDLELTNKKIIEFQEKNKTNLDYEFIIKSVTESITKVIDKNLQDLQLKFKTLENNFQNITKTKEIENKTSTEIITNDILNEIITNNVSIVKCKKCKKEKEQTEENFRIKNDKTFSLNCIFCLDKDKTRCEKKRTERNEYNKKYSEAQKKKIDESITPLHKCSKCSKVLEINEINFKKNEDNNFKKICIPCNIKIDTNRDVINQKHREYCAKTNNDKLQYEKHKDKKLEQKKIKYTQNKDKFHEKNKNYYEENKDKILEQKKEKYLEKAQNIEK